MDDALHGLKATIIDLGLARIDRGSAEVYYGIFDAETFEGEGDYQYDVYRMMRAHNDDSWEDVHPLSNVLVSGFFILVPEVRADEHVHSGCTIWQTS